uniref:Uncharacterized protein n=1 Tax=Sphaerodactylus townsendi TaxID=933632 RepID=A0ACB8GCX4_9SAUR
MTIKKIYQEVMKQKLCRRWEVECSEKRKDILPRRVPFCPSKQGYIVSLEELLHLVFGVSCFPFGKEMRRSFESGLFIKLRKKALYVCVPTPV